MCVCNMYVGVCVCVCLRVDVSMCVGDVIEDPLAPVSKPTSDEICVKKMHFLMTQLS